LLSHGWWFSQGNPTSSTTKSGRHNIVEILLKVALKHQKSIKNKTKVLNMSLLDKGYSRSESCGLI
jgi:hypothetical protein